MLRAADETLNVLDAVMPSEECIRLLEPFLITASVALPVLLATLKLLTKVRRGGR